MNIYERRVEDLSRTELIKVVRAVRQIVYPSTNVAEQWSSDHIQWVGETLDRHRLGPTKEAYTAAERRKEW